MPDRTAITVQRLNTPEGEAISFIDIDDVNGMEFPNSGREIIVILVPPSEAVDVTIKSHADAFGRVGDLTDSISAPVDANDIRAYGPLTPPENWGTGVKARLDFSGVVGTPQIAVVLT